MEKKIGITLFLIAAFILITAFGGENKYFKIKHCGIIDKPVTLFYYTREEAGRHLMA